MPVPVRPAPAKLGVPRSPEIRLRAKLALARHNSFRVAGPRAAYGPAYRAVYRGGPA